MRLLRDFGPRRLRRQRRRRDALSPLLRAVEKEAPPEGLLLSIEQALDDAPAAPETSRRALLAGFAGVGVALAGVWWLVAGAGRHVWLIDPIGRPVVRLTTRNGVTRGRMSVAPVSSETDQGWHLWGLSDVAPVHLGAFENGGVVLANARFDRFAVSLERAGFAGAQPLGPVVVLSAQEK